MLISVSDVCYYYQNPKCCYKKITKKYLEFEDFNSMKFCQLTAALSTRLHHRPRWPILHLVCRARQVHTRPRYHLSYTNLMKRERFHLAYYWWLKKWKNLKFCLSASGNGLYRYNENEKKFKSLSHRMGNSLAPFKEGLTNFHVVAYAPKSRVFSRPHAACSVVLGDRWRSSPPSHLMRSRGAHRPIDSIGRLTPAGDKLLGHPGGGTRSFHLSFPAFVSEIRDRTAFSPPTWWVWAQLIACNLYVQPRTMRVLAYQSAWIWT